MKENVVFTRKDTIALFCVALFVAVFVGLFGMVAYLAAEGEDFGAVLWDPVPEVEQVEEWH